LRAISHIVIHHSASPRSTTARQIALWHAERGWSRTGYHLVIEESGELILGRPIDTVGAHVKGHNSHSIGICLTGNNCEPTQRWNGDQLETLDRTLSVLTVLFPDAIVLGHRDLPGTATECPGLDVRELLGLHPL